ncbi:hypothetical protein AALP_AA3G107500 [Arabis alpina]|uniref:Uncharacterized protein n=1 Tax=Arabis alpina TaxID=50452 RepID=A0A087H8E1_ARAAL|nr:hypothetical protein AALP_AA3G107500 [Arabis alpina]
MWTSANSIAKLLFLLLLVEASFGLRYYHDWFPNGSVWFRWDIMSETRGSYTANVTIINYMKYHDIEGPWRLTWLFMEDEILLSTVGAEGKQVTLPGRVLVDKNKWSSPLNAVIVTEQIIPNCSTGSVIHSWYKDEADLAKSSTSFQITVARVESLWPPSYVEFSTPRSEYLCHSLLPSPRTPGYIDTWKGRCGILIES